MVRGSYLCSGLKKQSFLHFPKTISMRIKTLYPAISSILVFTAIAIVAGAFGTKPLVVTVGPAGR
jgi:hypothetical protein